MEKKEQVFLYMKEEIERLANLEEEKILDEAKRLEEEAYNQIKAEAKKDAEALLAKELVEISSNASVEASSSQEEKTKKLVEKRDEYVANIFSEAKDKLVAFAKEKEIDLTIIGMDDPLVGGVVDAFEAEGLRVFGPRKNAAIIEGSKAFSKDLMKKYNIPTAGYENFDSDEEALAYLETAKFPIVLKADGLALGKGVLICNTLEEAKEGVKTIMEDKKFGDAGNRMVIEEFMTGREVSVLAFCDGKTIKCMTSAQDHKRAKDGDQGLNTGGMGTFSPSPFYTKEVEEFCEKYVYQPTMDAMVAEGRPFV